MKFQTTRRLEFRDTDAAGIAHFSVFFTYMEEVEHEFLRSRGLSVVVFDDEGELGWPRVRAECDFKKPVRFEDVVQVELEIARLGERSVTYRVRFTRDGDEIAIGSITAACCRLDPGRQPRAIPIPAWIRTRLTEPDSAHPDAQ